MSAAFGVERVESVVTAILRFGRAYAIKASRNATKPLLPARRLEHALQ